MHKLTSLAVTLICSTGLAMALSSCAFIETTTETVQNTSEATTDFTSSTSPRSDSDSDKAEKVSLFTDQNFDRIREDMALGGGEHLASLATLMDIPQAQQPSFFGLTKERFSVLFSSANTTPEEMLTKLNDELAKHPNLRS
ncbi:MAG: DUF3015 domain-containing protein [Gammaproteobacteria bacterium]|nr:DUF3015 domain-containing protein [Gammaproteobacteria bacterium]